MRFRRYAHLNLTASGTSPKLGVPFYGRVQGAGTPRRAGDPQLHEVSTDIKREQIVGTPDMKPSLIAQKVKEDGLKNVTLPTCDVAGKAITNGGEAKCFASYMRVHALEATGGKTYAQMPQFATMTSSSKPSSSLFLTCGWQQSQLSGWMRAIAVSADEASQVKRTPASNIGSFRSSNSRWSSICATVAAA